VDATEPHILIVDDARDIREPLGQYLRRHGFRAALAAARPRRAPRSRAPPSTSSSST